MILYNISKYHGTYIIRSKLKNRCARKEQSLLFILFKAFNWIESSIVSSHKSDFSCLVFLEPHFKFGISKMLLNRMERSEKCILTRHINLSTSLLLCAQFYL